MPGVLAHEGRARVSAIILFCCWATTPAGGAPLSNVLRVSLTAVPTELRVGEALALSAVIENVSAQTVTIDSRRSVYTVGYLKVYDELGVQLDGFRTAIFAVTPPSAADFTTLNPGARFVIRVTGELKNGIVHSLEGRRNEGLRHHGLFLDFEDSAIPLPATGPYHIGFTFETMREWSVEAQGLFALRNVWFGSVTSPRVTIVVR